MKGTHPMDNLPKRQRQIVELTCDLDLSTDETARRLSISPATVKNHRTSIMRRFRATSICRVCTIYGAWSERQASAELRATIRKGPAMRADHV